MAVAESRIETVARLRRWGVWRIAQLAMADRREKLRAEGRTRREAREEAWAYVQWAFPESDLEELGVTDWDDLLDAEEIDAASSQDEAEEDGAKRPARPVQEKRSRARTRACTF